MWKILERIKNLFIQNNPGWKKEFNYVEQPKHIDITWQNVYTTGFIKVPINVLLARINTKEGLIAVPIDKTPHYKWIKDIVLNQDDSNSRIGYYNYIKDYYPEEDTDTELSKIKEMALSFKDNKPVHNSELVVFPPMKKGVGYQVVLYDGVHRSSIAMALGLESMVCYVVKEKLKNI